MPNTKEGDAEDPRRDESEVRTFWDAVAKDWRLQVGSEGDKNRRFNSDPVLWEFLGDVHGEDVLDAGCGTGYLSAQLRDRGARVTGVDVSSKMTAIARADHPDIEFRTESVSALPSFEDSSFDAVVANYVLMDVPNLQDAVTTFHRILRPGSLAVLVFSHPCFPQGRRNESVERSTTTYVWDFPYFEERRCVDPPWAHFTREFIWFHRPLSTYWKAFKTAGFVVEDFEEPRIAPERYGAAPSEEMLRKLKERPYSVAFKLRKPLGTPLSAARGAPTSGL